MRARIAALLTASCPLVAFAAGDATWPPPARTQDRMHELQAVIRSPDSTKREREAAREELGNLLKSPAGRNRETPEEQRKVPPARAAIEPYPSVVKPLPPIAASVPPAPGVAHLEVLPAPKPLAIDPRKGSVLAPAGPFAIDPATGAVLHEVPGGYVDPRSGEFVPRAGR